MIVPILQNYFFHVIRRIIEDLEGLAKTIGTCSTETGSDNMQLSKGTW
jgi:hypothetical protein